MENVIGTLELKKRSDIHWARKIWHMAGVSMMAAIYAYLPQQWSKGMLLVAWCGFISIDIIRQKNQGLNEFMVHVFKPILRQSELHKLAGTTYLLSGAAVVVFFFPKDVVILTLLLLAFADPIASIVGIKFGKDKIFGQKSLQGSLAAFFVCAVLTFGYMFNQPITVSKNIVLKYFGKYGSLKAIPVNVTFIEL